MPKPVVKQITSWSFSRYSDYKSCPFKAKMKHVDKIQEPPNPAMARGGEIHTMAENYIKGKMKVMPKELKLFADEFKKLKVAYKKKAAVEVFVEDSWAFTDKWLETVWNDWANCWVRIKLDCAHMVEDGVLRVIDWKTGKCREDNQEDYLEQLDLYALGAFLMFPKVMEVRPELKYLDYGITFNGKDEPLVYKRSDLPKLKKAWEKRVKAMLNDKMFPPRPNKFCGWCFYRKANKANGGGQCKF